MHFVEHVPDYILRNYLKVGQKVTICAGAMVQISNPHVPSKYSFSMPLQKDIQVTITNFLPGYTEVYAPHAVHNHQVVWIMNGEDGNPWEYRSTDINNVKEIRNA